MKKLHQLLALKQYKGDLGIEIETEGRYIKPMDSKFWRCERDGSLRGHFPDTACEFVLKAPLSQVNLQKAFAEFDEYQKDTVFELSNRCSTHVHVNMQDSTWDELLAFIYLCLLVEIPLMNFCQEHRRGNRFALRLSDAEASEAHLIKLFSGDVGEIRRMNGDQIRYSAINLHSLQKYGSVEFRGLEGTVDWVKVNKWTSALLQLRNISAKMGSPAAVHNYYIEKSNKDFLKEVFKGLEEDFVNEENEAGLDVNYSLTVALPRLWRAASEKAKAAPADVEVNVPAGRAFKAVRHNDGFIIHDDMVMAAPPQNPFHLDPFAPLRAEQELVRERVRARFEELQAEQRARQRAEGLDFLVVNNNRPNADGQNEF